MRPPLLLTSPDNPRLKQVVHLRKHRDRRKLGLFIAEGSREVGRALQAGLEVKELFWCPQVSGLGEDALRQRLGGLEGSRTLLFEVTPPLLSKLTYLENPEGIVAVVAQPDYRLDKLPAPSASDLFLVAAGTNKPGNLGAMVRTASAAGATAVLGADAEVDAFNPNAIRASTGAVFTLPVITAPSADVLAFLAARNVPVYAATPEAETVYTEVDLTSPCALLIGREDTGVPPAWRDAARALITIPMHAGTVDSLNASNAAAVLLFEALRQRRSHRR